MICRTIIGAVRRTGLFGRTRRGPDQTRTGFDPPGAGDGVGGVGVFSAWCRSDARGHHRPGLVVAIQRHIVRLYGRGDRRGGQCLEYHRWV